MEKTEINFVLVENVNTSSTPLKVKYRIRQEGNLQTIECALASDQPFPDWLQLKRFDFISLESKGAYDLLFEEKKFDKNLDTLLFLDRVYEVIMKAGSFPIN